MKTYLIELNTSEGKRYLPKLAKNKSHALSQVTTQLYMDKGISVYSRTELLDKRADVLIEPSSIYSLGIEEVLYA